MKIDPQEPCGNEFQSTGSHRLTVCTSTDSYYYFSAYTWGQKRNSFPQGSSGPIFKIPKNVISYEPTEPTFEWAKLFCDISLTLREHKYMTSEDFRGFGTIYHINHTAIRFCLTIRISIFNDVISLPILTDKNTFQTKANN